MAEKDIQATAEKIITNWVRLKHGQSLMIVTNEKYRQEAEALKKSAERVGKVMICYVPDMGSKDSDWVEENLSLSNADVVIGATEYSLCTTQRVKDALNNGGRFLSLPMSVNDDRSILSYNFLNLDLDKAAEKASLLLQKIQDCKTIRVTTAKGTDVFFSMEGRIPGFFSGNCELNQGFASACVEVYVPIVETSGEGVMVVDGSLGYIGKADPEVKVRLHKGRIVSVDDSSTGQKLQKYMEDFHDPEMFVASEFGIGLNDLARCAGDCYIEDESTYGTYHIGFGRNISLGGNHQASSHFDLVTWNPTIRFDDQILIRDGIILESS